MTVPTNEYGGPDREFKAGIQRTMAFFRSLERNARVNLPQAAGQAAVAILNRADKLVPIDEGLGQPSTYVPPHPGLLRQSGRVEVEEGGDYVTSYVIYGSAEAFYAVYVHERPATHKAPRQWKYLETAVQETTERLTQIFAKYLQAQPREGQDLIVEELEELSTESGPSGELYYGHPGGHGPAHTRAFGPGRP